MEHLLDLARYPLDRPDSPECPALADRCPADLAAARLFTLDGFVSAQRAPSAP